MTPVILMLNKALPLTFAATGCKANNFLFFLPPWYEYIPQDFDANCNLNATFQFPNDIWLVALAVVDMLVRLAGMAAVISIIISGVMYITSSGNPEKAASARRRIYNSFIGLGIAFVAAGVVAFIGNTLGG